MRIRPTGIWIFGLLSLTLASCARTKALPVYSVRGSVTFQKKPAGEAVVVLRPKSALAGNLLPHGEVAHDGTFQISTYTKNDGAPAGEYAVTITWPQVKPDPAGGWMEGPDRLKGKFNDPNNAKWNVTIKEGSNDLPPFLLD